VISSSDFYSSERCGRNGTERDKVELEDDIFWDLGNTHSSSSSSSSVLLSSSSDE